MNGMWKIVRTKVLLPSDIFGSVTIRAFTADQCAHVISEGPSGKGCTIIAAGFSNFDQVHSLTELAYKERLLGCGWGERGEEQRREREHGETENTVSQALRDGSFDHQPVRYHDQMLSNHHPLHLRSAFIARGKL